MLLLYRYIINTIKFKETQEDTSQLKMSFYRHSIIFLCQTIRAEKSITDGLINRFYPNIHVRFNIHHRERAEFTAVETTKFGSHSRVPRVGEMDREGLS